MRYRTQSPLLAKATGHQVMCQVPRSGSKRHPERIFVGGIGLNKHESFELELGDATLREWIKGDKGASDAKEEEQAA